LSYVMKFPPCTSGEGFPTKGIIEGIIERIIG
jgi:hypothetical protein